MDPTRPPFAQNPRMKNVLNIPTATPGKVARFYSASGVAAPDAQRYDAKYQRIYQKRQEAPRAALTPEHEGMGEYAALYATGGGNG